MRRIQHTFVIGFLLLGSTIAISACGEEPFRVSHPTNSPGEIKRVARRLDRATPAIRNSTGRPMAFMVATRPRGIVAYDLESGKVLWRKEIADTSSKIVVGRNHIFHRKGSTVLQARHLATGEVAWEYTLQYGNATEFYGMDADGDDLYFVATEMTGGRMYARFADIVKVDAATGRVAWKKRANGPLGAPAARSGMVFVPYRFQYLTVLDGKTGMEIARAKVQHPVKTSSGGTRSSPILVNFAWATSHGLFFGNDAVGAIRFSDRVESGNRSEVDFAGISLKEQRSVNARYFWDGYKPSMVAYTAIDRNLLLWRFAESGSGFESDSAVLQYYRYFFGFEASTGTLRWAYMHPATEVVSSAHIGKRIIYVSREGRFVMLDSLTGDKVWEQDTDIRIHGVTFDAHGFNPPVGKAEKNPPLLDVLKDVIREPDPQFQDAKIFALSQLVKVKGAELSDILLKIVNDTRTEVEVRRVAGEVLVERANADSLSIFLRALEGRYDFLSGTAPQGVGIIAKALGRIGSKEAVPALLAHLQEPQTPYSALEDIVTALIQIGDKQVVWPFSQFLLTYRGESDFANRINLLTSMAKTLIDWGGRAERQVLTFVAEDHHTLPQLREYLSRELGKTAP
ncbi:MAG: PQQ-binding-like beta-propeller repeat protein [Polyangia bacterium]|jgi:outer membrane protein assembly factor BamB|nr:PQQ-binding-like beta-propeller repeat protein [Polyangia bacterium]